MELPQVATVPYKGKKYPVVMKAGQWSEFRFDGNRFVVNKRLGENFNLLVKKYEDYCQSELKGVIRRGIAKLRTKKISTELEYTDGKSNFLKKVNMSVNDYIKLLGYSSNLDFKIGNYEREWGINEINPKSKKFTLYFNATLIKYDNGSHIEYVVAHELTHVFHRDHGPLFQKALVNLFPKKNSSEEFFNRGISNLFGSVSDNSGPIFYLIVGVGVLILLYWVFGSVSTFFQGLFNFGAPAKPLF